MKIINKIGYYMTLLLPVGLFMSYKGSQSLSYIIMLFFLIGMFSGKNRESMLSMVDRKMAYALIAFILSPFIVSVFSGGISSRVDNIYYLYWLIFFPLVYFIDTERKLRAFLLSFLIGGTASLIMSLGLFIRNYEEWANPIDFVYPRVSFELQTQDFANVMCLLLLFLLSFILFYRSKGKKESNIIKAVLIGIFCLNLFIIIVNRSKMVYLCLPLPLIYILYKKNRKYILGFLIFCICGYFILPSSISERLKYIIRYEEDPSSYLRILFWDAARSSIMKSPFFGMTTSERISFNMEHFRKNGVLGYIEHYYGLDPVGITNTHNMYLHHLANYGIAIITLAYFLFYVIPSRLLKLSYSKLEDSSLSLYVALEIGLKASFVAYIIQGLTEFNLSKKTMIYIFSIIIFIINFIFMKQEKDKEANR